MTTKTCCYSVVGVPVQFLRCCNAVVRVFWLVARMFAGVFWAIVNLIF